jgi:hypothetical protein
MSLYNLSVNSSSAFDREASCQVVCEGIGTESECVGGLMVPGVSVKVSGGRDSGMEESS